MAVGPRDLNTFLLINGWFFSVIFLCMCLITLSTSPLPLYSATVIPAGDNRPSPSNLTTPKRLPPLLLPSPTSTSTECLKLPTKLTFIDLPQNDHQETPLPQQRDLLRSLHCHLQQLRHPSATHNSRRGCHFRAGLPYNHTRSLHTPPLQENRQIQAHLRHSRETADLDALPRCARRAVLHRLPQPDGYRVEYSSRFPCFLECSEGELTIPHSCREFEIGD
ncbi:hypothetical protein EX30DRAFT_230968 [Ascodesmis nigricans]|uniref:Uncharacterized protein n=1 Tax=Ascodesmis nigricans TaxID=341454 RepID=A0A4S2MNA9_9PEZI|nr:hypothetical protein EX30DRAFT_230968 [Ascodesmis nigricans]